MEQLGQLPDWHSKDFSKKILELSNLVPPKELEAAMLNLETLIKKKLAEMDLRIKNLKPKKKKKADKKTFDERMAVLSEEKQNDVNIGMKLFDLNNFNGESGCCPG